MSGSGTFNKRFIKAFNYSRVVKKHLINANLQPSKKRRIPTNIMMAQTILSEEEKYGFEVFKYSYPTGSINAVLAYKIVENVLGKINCGSVNSDCKYSYKKNGTITLKATSNSGYSFKDANISCSGNDNRNKGIRTCKVKMTKNQNVKINFKSRQNPDRYSRKNKQNSGFKFDRQINFGKA